MGFHKSVGYLKRRATDALFKRLERWLDANRWADRIRYLADQLDNRRLREFIENTDFANLDVSEYPVANIVTGEKMFQFVDAYFCKNVSALIAYCLFCKKLPSVQLIGGGQNLWEQFFEQPYPEKQVSFQERLNSGFALGTCDRILTPLRFPSFPKEEDVRVFSKLFQPPLFTLNPQTRAYVEEEYEEIFTKRGNPRVMGVLCRGTDYRDAKYHPKQPDHQVMIEDVRKAMERLNCEYIYLATEEHRIQDLFDREFPGKVLINKRMYYDSYWEMRKELGLKARIYMVNNGRENDDYYRALEYLSSMILLSRCNALIAGSCGGSRLALYMNGGKYEYWYLYNLGKN